MIDTLIGLSVTGVAGLAIMSYAVITLEIGKVVYRLIKHYERPEKPPPPPLPPAPKEPLHKTDIYR